MKDNLARRNWHRETQCCLCNLETIQHLFFEYHYAKFLWQALDIVFGITSPSNVENLFGSWYKQGGSKTIFLLLTGAVAFC